MLLRKLRTIPCPILFAHFAKRVGKYEPHQRSVILSNRAPRGPGARESKDLRWFFSLRTKHTVFRIALLAFLLGLAMDFASAQQDQRYAVLPRTEAKPLIGYQLFNSSGKITGTWETTQADVEAAEAHLHQISNLSKRAESEWRHVDHPEKYFRQYLGLLEGARKLIYVNAFCGFVNELKPPIDWREHLLVVSDGGSCFWQAEYDVAAGQFVALSVNGLA